MKGKHLVLGITGGIAAYKCALLARLFVKAGAEVQVIMTPSAKEFITPLTMSTLTNRPVISEFFTANTGQWNSHVDLGLWADVMIIAPATACTIAKMATGVADNMLVTSYLSTRAKVFVAPAMDFDMMQHPTTERNLKTLAADGCKIIEARTGELASHLVGKGRMAEPEEIFDVIEKFFNRPRSLEGKKVMITAGPTVERIDPVRYISNFSTGKMGYALAQAAADRGAQVTLISGPVSVTIDNPNVKVVKIESAKEMLEAAKKAFPKSDVAIFSAAVADYAPKNQQSSKIKRESGDVPVIELEMNPDISATLAKKKKPSQITVGFALETNNEIENAHKKLSKKNLDFVVLNSLNDPGAGFGVDTNKITIIGRNGFEESYPLKSKAAVAEDIIDVISNRIEDRLMEEEEIDLPF